MKSMLLKVNIAIISIGSSRNHLHFVLKLFFFCIVTWISKDLIQAELYEKTLIWELGTLVFASVQYKNEFSNRVV